MRPSSARLALHFPPEFQPGGGPISVAARAGNLPTGVTPLSRVRALKQYYTGDVGALSAVQSAQILVAETNAGKLTVPTPAEKMTWTACTPPTWNFLTYNEGCAVNAWKVGVLRAGRAARIAGYALGGDGEWEIRGECLSNYHRLRLIRIF